MIEPNFIAIGKIPGGAILVHKDNFSLVSKEENTSKVKCIAIDFKSRRISFPVIIDYLLSVCPHDRVSSDGERVAIANLVKDTLSEKKIKDLSRKFEKIKYKKLV